MQKKSLGTCTQCTHICVYPPKPHVVITFVQGTPGLCSPLPGLNLTWEKKKEFHCLVAIAQGANRIFKSLCKLLFSSLGTEAITQGQSPEWSLSGNAGSPLGLQVAFHSQHPRSLSLGNQTTASPSRLAPH